MPKGNPKPDFILNTPQGQNAEILLGGDNFGCGSSREHAPWALTQFGFRAVISTSFADIFRQNSLKNSLLPIVVPEEIHAELFCDRWPGSKYSGCGRSGQPDVNLARWPQNRISLSTFSRRPA